MTTYRVVLRADVYEEVDIEADTEAQAEAFAYESINDIGYEVDFQIESIEPKDDV